MPMPNEVIERVNTLANQENGKWFEENLTENEEDKLYNEFNNTEAMDIGVIQFDDVGIAAEPPELAGNEVEQPVNMETGNEIEQPVNVETGDRNMLDRNDTIDENVRAIGEVNDIRNELEIDQMIEQDVHDNQGDVVFENQNLEELNLRENEEGIIPQEQEGTDVEHDMDAKYGP